MATPMLSAVLTLKSGEHREISYCVGDGGGESLVKRTHECLVKLQGDVNAVLTELVGNERNVEGNNKASVSTDPESGEEGGCVYISG